MFLSKSLGNRGLQLVLSVGPRGIADHAFFFTQLVFKVYKAFFMVTLPAAKSGIVTAVLLGVARIIGETAPLILTAVIANETNVNPLAGGMATLPTYIYNVLYLGDATSLQRAWGAALVLLILVGILFVGARLASATRVGSKPKRRKK